MATATESTSELPPQAQSANLKTLTQAMGETKITDDSNKADSEKNDEGESLEDGEIREDEEEEVDDGKPKTVFDSAKKFNLKVGPCYQQSVYVRNANVGSTPCTRVGHYTLILLRARCSQRHRALHLLLLKSLTVSPVHYLYSITLEL